MAETPLASVVRHLHRLAARPEAQGASDAHLLQQYVTRRDADAFAELTRRHGPLVWRVCSRLLPQTHLAEEAYQAAFLVLARRAAKIRKPAALGSWLYAVAYRIARQARSELLREQTRPRERIAAAVPDPASEAAWRELERIVVEEVHALPEKYRLPVLLCYWEGLTNEEAGLRLSWPVGTLKTRLLQARRLLHERLTRRGVNLSMGALITLLAASEVDALVPPCLSATADPVVSRTVAALADGAVRGMTALRVKTMLALLLGSVLVGGAGVLSFRAPEPQAKEAEPPKLEAKRPARMDRYGDPLPPGSIARLGTIRWRLPLFGVDRIVVAPDGKTLVTVNSSRGVSVWDSATGKVIRQVPQEPTPLLEWLGTDSKAVGRPPGVAPRATALSADGRTAAFASPDGTLHVVDIAAGKVRQRCAGHQGPIQEAVLSANGKFLASRADTTLRIWDTSSGEIIRRLRVPEDVWRGQYQPEHLAIAPNGEMVAWVSTEKGCPIHVHNVSTGEEKHLLLQHSGGDRGIVFSPNSDLLLATCSKGSDQLWDVRTGRLLRELPHKAVEYPSAAAFTPDESRVALAVPGAGLQLHEVATGKEIWRSASTWISTERESLAFATDGKTLFAKLAKPPAWVLRRYDTRTGEAITAPEESRGTIGAMVFAPDDRSLYGLGGDNRLWTWNATTGAALRQTPTQCWGGWSFSADGRFFALADKDFAVRLCESATGKEVWRQHTPSGRRAFNVAFSPDAASLAVSEWGNAPGAGHRIVFRAAADGEARGEIAGLDQPAVDLVFNPDGRSLVWLAGGSRLTVHFREASTGRQMREPLPWVPNVLAPLTFSPDGKTLAIPGKQWESVDLLECAGWRKRLELPPATVFPCPLAFSPDGLLFMMGDLDGAVRIFDAHTGRLLRRQEGHRARVKDLAFSHDGRKLVTLSEDTTALVWDIADLLRIARGREVELAPTELQSLWAALADPNAVQGYQTIRRLARSGRQVIPWLRTRLRPVPPTDPQRLARLMAELDDDRFEVREKATKELAELGELAVPALRKTLAGQPAPELRRRAESLVKQVEELSPQRLRMLRSVEAIESIGGAEAESLLKELAGGNADACLTREAKASLERLAKRQASKP